MNNFHEYEYNSRCLHIQTSASATHAEHLRSCDGCSAAVLRARGDLSGTLDNVGQSKLFRDHKDQNSMNPLIVKY